jgi:DNA-binding CsgD family transcriptional regulator
MLDGARRGESAVLVIRGEAGIGKTALLQHCARQAGNCRVVQIAGVESEFEMPFAGVHQLCRPLVGQLAAVPGPQQHALHVAFGLAAGNAPDPFFVGLAVLSLLAEAAAEQPLVCLVDDAQWLDAASSQVLAFVGRRLLAEAVVLVFAVREVDAERLFPALPALTIEGLAMEVGRALLTTVVPGHMDERVRDRIVAESRGNPLALLELPRTMGRAELSGGFAVPTSAPSGDLLDHYLRRIHALPERTRQLLLLAAADPTGDATLLWRAGQGLGVGPDAAAVAESEQLLEIGLQVRFRHPLVRSAAYLAGMPEDRRAAHVALAAATDEHADRDRRVWHLAAAATGPDDDIAAELERMAGAARARGGVAAAAAFLERSGALTSEPRLRAERTLDAAEANRYAGAFNAALGLLAGAEAVAVDDLQRARVERLRGQIQWASTPGREAPVLLLRAAARLERLDVGLARETYLEAWLASFTAGRFAQAGGHLREVSRAARRAPHPAHAVKHCDLFLDGCSALVSEGHEAAEQPLRDAVNMFLDGQPAADWLQWGWVATGAACMIWDADSLALLGAQHIDVCRASGALAQLVFALDSFAMVAVWRGDFEAAMALIAEAAALKDVTGIRMYAPGELMLAAYQGRPEEASPLISAVVSDAIAGGEGLGFDVAQWATAILQNGLGGYAEASAAAEQVVDEMLETNITGWALAELVEGAARSGKVELADEALRRLLAAVTHLHGSDWALGIAARTRALLAKGPDVERWYAEAVERLGRTPFRIELARAHLLYGEWLRRANRRIDARHQLRTAYDSFASIGAEAFAERTRRELTAAGEKVRKRQIDTRNDLTAQEEHVARLARDGRTNSEIGAELFLSARTVEWHLGNVYTKLGIASRRDLQGALPRLDR